MPKYDAFGREIGEDTLAGLGGGGSASPEPAITPSPSEHWSEASASVELPATEPRPEAPPPASFGVPGGMPTPMPAPVPPKPRRRRKGGVGAFGCLFSLVMLALVLAGPVIALVAILNSADDTIESVRDSIENSTDFPATPADAEQPTGAGGRSMLAPANLAGAIERWQGERGRLGRLVIYPNRGDADLVLPGNRYYSVVYTFTGQRRQGDPLPVAGQAETLAWRLIDPQVPAKLIRAASRRAGVDPSDVTHAIAQPDLFEDDPVLWTVYFDGGKTVYADERGRIERID